MSDDTVGYGKPPRHSRFTKGRSGNPRGRMKGGRNFRTVLLEEMQAQITLREGGIEHRLTKLQGVAKSLVNQALKGNVRAITELVGLLLRLDDGSSTQAEAPLSLEEQLIFDAALARLMSEPSSATPGKDDEPPPASRAKKKRKGSA